MKKIAICMMLIMALMCCSLALAEELAVTRLPQDAAVQPADGVYVLDQSGSYAAYGTTMDVRIEVAADVTLILSGAQISLSEEDAAPISVRPGARLTLVVADGDGQCSARRRRRCGCAGRNGQHAHHPLPKRRRTCLHGCLRIS